MFLNLKHEGLDICKTGRSFVHACYRMSKLLPPDERFAMTQQLRRAALSVHLNIAEGCSRKSVAERKRFYEISRGSLVEIDALLDVAFDLEYLKKDEMKEAGNLLIRSYQMLSKMIDP
ncbi:MAG: four helix bundle protein [Chitinophagaceae bacterium]|nr:MAG: four helix bundle protein [Chitinophagaceae bacterium]